MAPVDMSQPESTSPNRNFTFEGTLKVNNVIPVHKYRSLKTGLTVVVAEVEGPVVNGFFCLATEAHDDDGLPHTLEHLIFLGSEDYPYKGVLDLLANRCLASGTNAWTDTDHTCYTMTTAGSEGFLSLMPIYLDHILYPTLKESGFITEVHHVNGEGRDGGVVYAEMQGRENSGESLVNLALLRSIYPGKCGYKSETGGIMKNLRDSTTNEKVRAYHKDFYRPENLWVIIVGHVKPESVLESLEPVEKKIISKGSRGDFKRPWQDPVPPLVEKFTDLEVLYPNDDEDNGMVYMGWRGPSAVKNIYELTACAILLKYLTDTSVSPLPKEFVDIPDPYASKVSYSLVENAVPAIMLMFENVPLKKLKDVYPKLVKTLTGIASSEKPFDMKRMSTVIHRHRLECLINLENSPHESIAYMVIGHMLYGNNQSDLEKRLNLTDELEKMEKEPMEFWLNILTTYLIDNNVVSVRGIPSIKEQQRVAKEEEDRVNERKKTLGEAGLAKNAEKVKNATAENDIPPPNSLLTSVPIPDINSINFHSIKPFTTESTNQPENFDLSKVPIYAHIDDLNTNFVYMFLIMDSSSLDARLRPYLPLFLELLLESSIERNVNGSVKLVPYEDVIAELEADTIATGFKVGLDSSSRFTAGPFSNFISFTLQLEPKKYEKGIQWIREILYQTVISKERIKIIATKIINNVAEVKRKGNKMVESLMKGLMYRNDSNHCAVSILKQQKFLAALLKKMDQPQESESVLQDLKDLRNVLTDPKNMLLHLSANLQALLKNTSSSNLAEPWSQLLSPDVKPAKSKLSFIPDYQLMDINQTERKSCVAGIGSVESAFMCQTTPTVNDFNHEDLAPLLVFLQYLTQLEGPLWKQIRGLGYSYHYNILPRPQEGKLYLTMYRASNVVGAYKEAKSVIQAKLTDSPVWEQTLFDSAKSSLIFEIVHREKCIGDVVVQSLLSYFKGVDHSYNQNLVKLIWKLEPKDMQPIGTKYIKDMFNNSVTKTTVVCHPGKVQDVADGLSKLGLELVKYSSIEESFLNSW